MIKSATTLEEKAVLVAYIASKIGTTPQRLVGQMPFEVFATIRDGKPTGALLYSNYRGTSIEMSAAGENGWLTRGVIKMMFAYPFGQLNCWSLLTLIGRNNTVSREISRRLGFAELCVIESGLGKSNDTLLYAMTRDKCAWLEARAAADDHHELARVA
jgi:hypothetical protein